MVKLYTKYKILVTLVLQLCFAFISSAAFASADFTNAYIIKPLGKAPVTAAYGTLKNDTDKEIKLISISSTDAELIEMHNHEQDPQGIVKMMKIDSISVPAQSEVTLKSGGLHLMVFGLKKPIQPGDNFPITLNYSDGSKVDSLIPVKTISGK